MLIFGPKKWSHSRLEWNEIERKMEEEAKVVLDIGSKSGESGKGSKSKMKKNIFRKCTEHNCNFNSNSFKEYKENITNTSKKNIEYHYYF